MISGIVIAHLLREKGWMRAGSCGFAGHVDCLMRRPVEIVDGAHVHGLSCTADICGPSSLVCEGPCRTSGEICAGHPLPSRFELTAASIARRIGTTDEDVRNG